MATMEDAKKAIDKYGLQDLVSKLDLVVGSHEMRAVMVCLAIAAIRGEAKGKEHALEILEDYRNADIPPLS